MVDTDNPFKHRTFTLIAPSGYPTDQASVQRALKRLHEQGARVTNTVATQRRFQRFAGTDAERLADLNQLADPAQPLPDIVMAIRGGYGAARILPTLDYAGLQRRLMGQPTVLVGHSDFTAIQMALLAKAGLPTFSGPMLCSDFGAEVISNFTMQHFQQILTQPAITIRSVAAQSQSANVSGTLWGGNLAIIVSLIGTPYFPQIDGGILFLEDVNESPFRIERMLYQLHYAGVLARQQALVLGDFGAGQQVEQQMNYGLLEMIEQIRSVIGIPVITHLPFGHCADLVTLPVGVPAQLMANELGFSLTVRDYPYQSINHGAQLNL